MNNFLNSVLEILQNFDWKGSTAISLYICLGLVYILAHILNKKTECVILWKWYDVTCIFLTAISPIIILIWSSIASTFHIPDKVILWGMLLIIALPMCVSFIISIISNLGNGLISILYIAVSILTKIMLLIFSPVIVIAWFAAKDSGKDAVKDGRFRDGTRGNEKTRLVTIAIGFFVLLFYPLVFSLIKPKENAENVKDSLKSLAGI